MNVFCCRVQTHEMKFKARDHFQGENDRWMGSEIWTSFLFVFLYSFTQSHAVFGYLGNLLCLSFPILITDFQEIPQSYDISQVK